MIIRKADSTEMIAVLALYKKELERLIEFNESSGKLLKELVHKQKQYELDENSGYFVTVKNDEIIGAILVEPSKIETAKYHKIMSINHLAVSKNHRSLTIGSQLLEHAEDMIRKHMDANKLKSSKIIIEISEEVSNSTEFFTKLGFVHEGMISDYHVDGVKVSILGKTLRH